MKKASMTMSVNVDAFAHAIDVVPLGPLLNRPREADEVTVSCTMNPHIIDNAPRFLWARFLVVAHFRVRSRKLQPARPVKLDGELFVCVFLNCMNVPQPIIKPHGGLTAVFTVPTVHSYIRVTVPCWLVTLQPTEESDLPGDSCPCLLAAVHSS